MEEKKQKGNFWLTAATFIVNKRKAFFILFAIACVYSVVCMNRVSVNQDITKYLPADSETRIGLSLMDEQFTTYGSARVMVSNITWEDADALVDDLEKLDGVKSVEFDRTQDHYTGTDALFDVTFDGTEDEQVSKDARAAVKEALADYDTYISTSVGAEEDQIAALDKDMNVILVLAVVIIVAVLLLSTKAYMEIPVLLITFGVAALLNKGTNYWMGTISSVTNSIAVVLQLALAIDYAIIFCDRFMEEHEHMDSESAVKVALSKAIPEISASSLTTISGMVAMMFMHFRLGYDMGIVLVKAIVFSLISVFFLMPGILMIFAKGIDKSHHRSFVPNITFAGKWANLTRFVVPPVFIVFLVVAFLASSNCTYLYDTNSVESSKESENRIAREKIEHAFGTANQLVVMVPKGDYEAEKKALAAIDKLDYVNSALGLANVSVNDDYVLTDKMAPRAFSEMTDLDIEIVRLLYAAYAYDQGQNGPIFTGIDEYQVPIIDMVVFLYDQYEQGYVKLDADMDKKLTDLYDTLHDAQLQLQGTDYSRFVLSLDLPAEGDETYAAMDEIRGICAKYYPKSDIYLVGDSTSDHDLMSSFASDNLIITVLTALFVMIILLFTFQSAGLPVLLVLTIQGSIWVNFSVPAVTGEGIFFIAYLIVSAIQMGATIDYAIVISSRYLALKKELPIKKAIVETINTAFPTIFTSGTILTSAGFLIGQLASDPTVSSIGTALGRGTLISILLVLFVLPQILLLGDIIIEKTALTINLPLANTRTVAGKMTVNGHVKGYVQGEIDAEIKGSFSGTMTASFESKLPGGRAAQLSVEGQPDAADDSAPDAKNAEGKLDGSGKGEADDEKD
ncbi:MAG: MMPL family transporter [Eubacteriales bacterium]|nr:MMPL family transporter [Eubacteriales bacterium]